MQKSPNRTGQRVADRYDLVEIVGRGGQGTVYRALDSWSGREVAVKVLGSKAAREPQMVERLMREHQALTVLKGTAAVELFDIFRGAEGELCLVMEFLRGRDLDEHLYELGQRQQRMPLDRIGEIFEPIVATLDTAHAAGILHRDLKPANIFLLDGGGVRLLDFGMARLRSAAPLTAAGTVMGSPSFMAPEAWTGLSDLLDARADVYSLGVILFFVLTNELPFSGTSLQEKLLAATSAKRPSIRALRPDLPRDADRWVELALARDREQRFANARALWNAFVATFHVRLPGRGSLWAKAKGAVQKFAGERQAPSSEHSTARTTRAQPPALPRETVEAQVPKPGSPAVRSPNAPNVAAGKTIYIDDAELEVVPEPPRPPPRRTVEKTESISAEIVIEPSEDVGSPTNKP